MPVLSPEVERLARVLLLSVALVPAAPGQAAQGLASAPVQAQIRSDVSEQASGASFTVSLQLSALADMSKAQLNMRTFGCAELLPGQAEHADFSLKARESMRWQFRYRLLTDKPCHVLAEVVSLETPGARLASVFSVTINARREPLPEGTTRGRTAEGRKTVEAPGAPQ